MSADEWKIGLVSLLSSRRVKLACTFSLLSFSLLVSSPFNRITRHEVGRVPKRPSSSATASLERWLLSSTPNISLIFDLIELSANHYRHSH